MGTKVLTSSTAPLGVALTAFLTAAINLVVVLGLWHAGPEQIASVNTFVLSLVGVVATLRAGAQHNGTLSATPDGNGGHDA